MNKSERMIPNQLLKEERERHNWSQQEVAEKVGVDEKTVGRWERGTTFPYPLHRERLCMVFGKKPKELGLIRNDVDEGMRGSTQFLDRSSQLQERARCVEPCDSEELAESMQLLNIRSMPHSLVEDGERRTPHVEQQPKRSSEVLVTEQRTRSLPLSHYLISASLGALGMLLIVTLVFFSLRAYLFPASAPIRAGGQWISPEPELEVHDVLHFAARAFPLQSGNPAIDHIDFTLAGPGARWITACRHLSIQSNDDIAQCDVNLHQLGVKGGRIRISFNVYDRAGHATLAPDGMRGVIYIPSS